MSDKLDVLAAPNASVKSRQTTISLQANGNSKSIQVNQSPIPFFVNMGFGIEESSPDDSYFPLKSWLKPIGVTTDQNRISDGCLLDNTYLVSNYAMKAQYVSQGDTYYTLWVEATINQNLLTKDIYIQWVDYNKSHLDVMSVDSSIEGYGTYYWSLNDTMYELYQPKSVAISIGSPAERGYFYLCRADLRNDN